MSTTRPLPGGVKEKPFLAGRFVADGAEAPRVVREHRFRTTVISAFASMAGRVRWVRLPHAAPTSMTLCLPAAPLLVDGDATPTAAPLLLRDERSESLTWAAPGTSTLVSFRASALDQTGLHSFATPRRLVETPLTRCLQRLASGVVRPTTTAPLARPGATTDLLERVLFETARGVLLEAAGLVAPGAETHGFDLPMALIFLNASRMDYSIESLARDSEQPRRRLARSFTEQGTTVRRELARARLELALTQLFDPSADAADDFERIAERSGFANVTMLRAAIRRADFTGRQPFSF